MSKSKKKEEETPEIGDAIGVSDLYNFLFSLDEKAFQFGEHPTFGKLIRTVKLQMIKGNHFKYWHGTLYERGHVRKWGRIGTKGQEKEFPVNSAKTGWCSATAEFESKVCEKIQKGYQYAGELDAKEHIKE